MKKLIYIGLILLAGCSKPAVINEFSLAETEGYIAFIVSAYQLANSDIIPLPDKTCDCGGTGKFVHGDGHETPCPCEPTCKCKKKVEQIKRILFFTSKNCSWCNKFKKDEIPSLQSVDPPWTIGEDNTNLIQVIDTDSQNNNKLVDKFNIESLPTFVLIQNNKEISRKEGYITSKELTDMFYGTKNKIGKYKR